MIYIILKIKNLTERIIQIHLTPKEPSIDLITIVQKNSYFKALY